MTAFTITLPAPIGAKLGGGTYAGPRFLPDGTIQHLIAAPESLGNHEWKAAKTQASEYRGGGFDDWFLPEKSHLTVALLHIKDKLEQDAHWTSSPYGHTFAWAVYFESGGVHITGRSSEFRVRPFRSHQFTPSSILPTSPAKLPFDPGLAAAFGTSLDLNLALAMIRSAMHVLHELAPGSHRIDFFALLIGAAEIIEHRNEIMDEAESALTDAMEAEANNE